MKSENKGHVILEGHVERGFDIEVCVCFRGPRVRVGGVGGREFRHMLRMLGKRGHVERGFCIDIRVCMHLMGYLMEWASHKNVASTSVGPTDL